jgi:transketolase
MVDMLAGRLAAARDRLDRRGRAPRNDAPNVEAVYECAGRAGEDVPDDLRLEPGTVTTLRAQLGRVFNHYNRRSGGAILAAAADLLGSTSVDVSAQGFPEGYFNTRSNAGARLLSTGGICEDAMIGILSGLSAYGRHIGVGSSYAAFIAALGHIPARLHAIGAQARHANFGDPYRPVVMVCAHAGLKTGEDGPTHADPQPLQLLQGNFPRGTMVTLTPWDPAEIWPLMSAAFSRRPAVIAPFVTRPNETVLDRAALGLAPATAAASGLYLLRAANGESDGTLVLQGSGVTYAFIEDALPRLEADGIDLNVYYVASAELFDALPEEEQQRIFPEEHAREAVGITGFTLPTMERWIRSEQGRAMTLHPFRKGHFLGSGPADRVLAEAGLDGESQFRAIRNWVREGLTEAV